MELSDVAKGLWTYYGLPWEADEKLREEKNAIVAVHGKLDELRDLRYIAMAGEPMIRRLSYREKGRGQIDLLTAQGRQVHFGCEAMLAYHAQMKRRLQESGTLGATLAAAPSTYVRNNAQRQRTMRNQLVPDLAGAAETFIKYIEAHEAYALQHHR